MPRRESDVVVIIKHPKHKWWVRLDLPYVLMQRNTYQVKVSSSERDQYQVNSRQIPEATATELGRQIGRILGKRWGKMPPRKGNNSGGKI